MANVPIVEYNQRLNGAPTRTMGAGLNVPKMRMPDLPDGSILANATMKQAENINKVLTGIGDIALGYQNRVDKAKVQDYENQLNQFEVDMFEDIRMNKQGNAGLKLREEYLKKFDDFTAKMGDGLGGVGRDAFEQLKSNRRTNMQDKLGRLEFSNLEKYEEQSFKTAIESGNANIVNVSDDERQAEVYMQRMRDSTSYFYEQRGAGKDFIDNEIRKNESGARLAVLTKKVRENPASAMAYFNQYKTSFYGNDETRAIDMMAPLMRQMEADSLASDALSASKIEDTDESRLKFIIRKLEGNAKPVMDTNGYITQYGLNAKYNKGVGNLTEPEAIQQYINKKDYSLKGVVPDDADPRFKLVAQDTLIQHGKGRELIAQANGDWKKLLEIRKEYVLKDMANNPQKYKDQGIRPEGMLNRFVKLEKAIERMGRPVNAVDMELDILESDAAPEVKQDAIDKVRKSFEAAAKARKEAFEQAAMEGYDFYNKGLEVPADVEARMHPKDVYSLRKLQRSGEPDLELYMDFRSQILAGGNPDIKGNLFRLGNKATELIKLMQDPKELSGARTADDIIKSAYPVILGGLKAPRDGNEDDHKKIDAFHRQKDIEVQAFVGTHGRQPIGKDMQEIVDRLLLRGDVITGESFWGGAKTKEASYYELSPVEREVFVMEPEDDNVVDALAKFMNNESNRAAYIKEFGKAAYDESGNVSPTGIRKLYTRLRKSGLTDKDIAEF